MAVAFIGQVTANNIRSAGTTNLTANSIAVTAAGSTLIAWISMDNTSSTAPVVSSITKPGGEGGTWTKLGEHNSSTATSGGGVRGELWGIQTTTSWPLGTTITPTFSVSITAKVFQVYEFSGATITLRGTAGAGTATGGGATATTAGTAPVTGDLVLGLGTQESDSAASDDGDTSNGSWGIGRIQASSGGSAAANVSQIAQWKIVTGSGHQTYNPTLAGDCGSLTLALIPNPNATVYAPTTVAGSTRIGTTAALVPMNAYKPTSAASSWFRMDVNDDASQIGVINLGTSLIRTLNGGATWTSAPVAGASWTDLAYGNGYWVLIGGAGGGVGFLGKYSTDLTNWTDFDPWGGTNTVAVNYNVVDYGNGWWCIVTANGSAYINGNPTGTWTTSNTQFGGGNNANIYTMAYLNGVWLTGPYNSDRLYFKNSTPDGAWATTHSTNSLGTCFAYGNGYWMFTSGNNGTAYYTTTVSSSNWTAITHGSGWNSGGLYNVVYDYQAAKFFITTADPTVSATTHLTESATTPNTTWTVEAGKWNSSLIYAYGHVSKPQYTGIAFDEGYIVDNLNRSKMQILTPAGPSTVAGATTIGTPGVTTAGGTDATVTGLTTVAATVTISQAAGEQAPVTVAATTTVGAVTFTSNVTATLSTVAATTTVATVGLTMVAGLAVVPATVTVGTPTFTSQATPAPSTVAVTTTIGTVAIAELYVRPYGITTTTLTFS